MKFSVLMAVYCEDDPDLLNEAIKSIWDAQTLKPAQIIIVCDGPIYAETETVLAFWEGHLGGALQVIRLPQNQGLASALNEGLKYCEYELVARMDADDISLSNRFEAQIEFLRKNPHIDVLSSYIEEYDESLCQLQGVRSLPLDHESIRSFAKHRNPISHPAAVFRKEAVLQVGGYPPFRKSQDYALWSKMLASGHQMANLESILLKMRLGKGLQQRRGWSYLKEEIKILRYQLEIGFISKRQFMLNFFIRSAVRLSPASVKAILYKFAR